MANFFEKRDRNVIPNWRSFEKTVALGELSNPKKSQKINRITFSLEEYIKDWENNQTPCHAGDLISAAISNSQVEIREVLEAANFIIHSGDSTIIQKQLAKKLLNCEQEIINKTLYTLDDFIERPNQYFIYTSINNCKKRISENPHNFINYIELSRLYSIIGEKDKSIKKMEQALFLNKNNRFALRSASRLYAHFQELDKAHDILRKNYLMKYDPWLLSCEISMSRLRGITSKHIKAGLDILSSKNFHPFSISELASCIGTVEFYNGSMKSSKKLFRQSLVSPNDNSLAQAKWITSENPLFDLDINTLNLENNYEALTIESYYSKDWSSTVKYAERWFLDMPFTSRPAWLGNTVASSLLDNQELSIKFCKAALVSHPNDPLFSNNIAYSLALLNRTEEALEYINKAHKTVDSRINTCIKATKGLIYFRKGFWDIGKMYYLESIQEAIDSGNKKLSWIAILNLAREQMALRSTNKEEIFNLISKVPDGEPEIDLLKQKIEELYRRRL